jgi:NADPH:quinone reductase-like Zn-dependent oxidoreductase
MKAAVLHQFGETPRFEDFPDPNPREGQVSVQVKAVALENIDKMMADGSHYASRQFLSNLPAIVGFDGIGTLEDGSLIGFGGVQAPYGAMAEKTVIPQGYHVPIPNGVDAVTAAALPASTLTALFPLKWGAKLQSGETVLINGATGVSGKIAIQIAKYLGAGRVIGTGRNPESLERSRELGADAIIDLKQPDEQILDQLRKQAGEGYDVILDFLWGHPTELLIQTLVPHELKISRSVRLVQIGEKAGSSISLPANALRTSGLQILGGAAGITPDAMAEATNLAWDWIKAGKLHMDIEVVPLKDIEQAWERTDFQGRRIVIVP